MSAPTPMTHGFTLSDARRSFRGTRRGGWGRWLRGRLVGRAVGELGGGFLVDGLVQVVGGFVVADPDPVVEGLHLGRVGGPAELEGQGGDALVDEVDLVGADEAVLVGLLVELDFDVVELADGAGVVAEGGLAETLDLEIAERKERQVHVHVEVGDDVRLRHGGLGGEVLGAELAHLFSGERDEEDGALGARAGGEDLGGLDDGGDAGGVVHGAVVDGVAVDGAADAEVVEVRADDDVLLLQLAVGAFEFADYVGGIDGGIGVAAVTA